MKTHRIQDGLPGLYEPPRLEPSQAFRGPQARTGGLPPIAAWNIVCSDCSSGGGH